MDEQDGKKATQAVRQVFTIVERDGKNFWTRIGAAFTNRDGSETVLLDALPLNGRIQIPKNDCPDWVYAIHQTQRTTQGQRVWVL